MKRFLTLLIVLSVSLFCFGACADPSFEFHFLTDEQLNIGDEMTKGETFGLRTFQTQKQKDPSLKKDMKKLPHDGARVWYECTEITVDQNQNPIFYGSYDTYQNEIVEAEYLHSTDVLCFYFKSFPQSADHGKGIADHKAKQIAEDFLKAVMSEEKFSQFTYVEAESVQRDSVSVAYMRYIHGYLTDERLSVTVHPCGEVASYNGKNLYKYDKLESRIKKETLEEAEQELKAGIDALNLKNVRQGDAVIITNSQGKLFLRISIFHDIELSKGNTVSADKQFYVNLEKVEPLA